ncbi:Cytochrome P450 monooxygenase-like protein [Cladobotryum mycophilum]|uniref:Cytochrome P450 monooxygenase-like protein n=1 Tax=Cladobotryum mycophilum TaxID=491253 RepID=A0ABR0T407_9HYPO
MAAPSVVYQQHLDTNVSSLNPPGLDHGVFDSGRLSKVVITAAITFITLYVLGLTQKSKGATVANRLFSFEPRWFARFRWSIWAKDILDAADKKAQGRPYMLSRGDKDLIVLPPQLIPDLNRLGPDVLDSRRSHSFMLLGRLTGMQVVEKTSYHVRMLLSRISPALPDLLKPIASKFCACLDRDMPQGGDWVATKLNPITVKCLSEGMAIVLFGPELAKDPRLSQLSVELTMDIFMVAFMMRLVPTFLQPIAVWLVPAKWRLHRRWNELRGYVVPEVLRQVEVRNAAAAVGKKIVAHPDLISWMVQDGKTDMERDPEVLTTLCGSVAAGSIFSIANFVCRALSNLAAHPDVLEAIREEIRETHASIGGRWDAAAMATMDRLESAMKETARQAPPGTLIVYSRAVQQDVNVGGYELKKDQFVTMSWAMRAMNPDLYEDPENFHGLRFCAPDKLEHHRAKPFRALDNDILAWGAGRWACPGRHVADMAAKVLLIKLLNEYDFGLVDGKPLHQKLIHEFGFFDPDDKMLVRRRTDAVPMSWSP